jgi:HPt (histidine-containing phosphotransfer) domain-containing protein
MEQPLDGPLNYEFALEAAGGSREQFLVLARLFLQYTPELMQRLDLAAGAGNAGEVALHAHSLEGSAGAIGGTRLSTFAGNLTQAARATKTGSEIPALLVAVGAQWKELADVLEKIVQLPPQAKAQG